MRWILVASALTAGNALPETVQEIIAQGMTENWLIETLSVAAPFGRHHLRKRRSEECIDKHGSCSQYIQHCTNSQFQTTCPLTCNSCPDDSPDQPAEKEEVADDGCIDTMQYCPSMDKYCDNADYQGVRLYCRKTCNSCEENLQPALNDAVANATQANACEDKAWCSNFPYCNESQQLRERIVNDCPVECKEQRCAAHWKTAPAPEETPKAPEQPDECNDQSQACAGISELCDQDNYMSTLQTYCQKTCNFCTPSAPADPSTLPEVDPSVTGDCTNQYPNCEGMKFLCTEEKNEYNQRYRELCPETCGLCGEGDAVAPTTPAAAEPVAPLEPKETGKCEDKAKNCNELIDFCTQENTNAMMRAQCAMTCAFCSTESTPELPVAEVPTTAAAPALVTLDPNVCEDQPGHDCNKYLSYCANTSTKVPELCKKTCGLCGDGTPPPAVTTETATTEAAAPVTTPAPVTTAATTPAVVVTTAATATAATGEAECVLATKDKSPASTCKKYAKFCESPKYKKKLSFQCPLTCKVCQKPATTPKPGPTKPGVVECKDKVPKQCTQLKRHCKAPKYEKVLKFKCPLTCGFCTADGSPVTTKAPVSTDAKVGDWSIKWSRCSPQCQQYKSRKCLKPPCAKSSLYKFQKCPAAEYPNIAKCQAGAASGGATTPVQTCKNAAGRAFCTKHAAKCNSQKMREKVVMDKQCRLQCGICTQ